MRNIDVEIIKNAVADGFIRANLYLPESLKKTIGEYADKESDPLAKSIFDDMKQNLVAADDFQIPICQDCGMAVVFMEVGQEVHFTGGDIEKAIHEGVAKGYTEGYLRKSVVKDPLRRENTNDNSPAVIFTRIVPGDEVSLCLAPKGFGSENMSRIKMFNPTTTKEQIIDYIADVVRDADARPCPPVVIGVGIGGDFEYAAMLSKKALCRDVDIPNKDPFYADMENAVLVKVNETGIGPQGFGGDCTALACNIETYPTHIAGLPVAVNIGCHVTRHYNIVI